MARKKEFLEARAQITVRLDAAVNDALELALLGIQGGTKARAVDEGLRLWIAARYGDKHLQEQLAVAMKAGTKKAQELARIVNEQKAGQKANRSGTEG